MKSDRFEFYAGESKQGFTLTIGGSETITDAEFEFTIKRRVSSTTAIVIIKDDDFDKTSLASLRKLSMDLDFPAAAHGEYLGFLKITMADGGIEFRPKPPRQVVFNIISAGINADIEEDILNYSELTGGGDTDLHWHASDRDLANATGIMDGGTY